MKNDKLGSRMKKYGTFVSPHGTAHVLMSYENIKSMMKKAKDE